MADRPTDMNILCPTGYNALVGNMFWAELKDWNGYDEDMDNEDFLMDAYELTESQVSSITSNLKKYTDVIPPSYGTEDSYVIPVDVVETIGDWGGNIFLSDVGDLYCDGLEYRVFILSTEAWGML